MITVENTFSNFEQARLEFVRNLSALTDSTNYIEIFQASQTIPLLKPLLKDPNSEVQIQSSQTLLRLTDSSEELANETIETGIGAHLIQLLQDGSVCSLFVFYLI